MMDNSKLLMLHFTMEENEKLKRAITISGMKDKISDFFNAKLIKFFGINNGSYESFYDYSLDISMTFRGYLAKHSVNGSLYGYYPSGNTISYMVIVNDDVFVKLIELYNAAPADITSREIGAIAISAIMVAVDMDVNTTIPHQPITAMPPYIANPNVYMQGMCAKNPFIPIHPNGSPAPFPMKQEENVNPVPKPVVGQPEIGQPVQTASLPKPTSELIEDVMGAAKVSGKPDVVTNQVVRAFFNSDPNKTTIINDISVRMEELREDIMHGLGIDTYKGFKYTIKPEHRRIIKDTVLELEVYDDFDETKIVELNKKLASMSYSISNIVIKAMEKRIMYTGNISTPYYELTITVPNYSYKKFITEWATTNEVKIHNPKKLAASFRYLVDRHTGEIINRNIPRVVIVK